MDKIKNPLTGRWIKTNGKVYKDLIKKKIIDSSGKIIPIKVEPFVLEAYVFSLPEIIELIFLNLNNEELWKIRRVNRLILKVSTDIITKRFIGGSNIPADKVEELGLQVYLSKGANELELFLRLFDERNNSRTASLKWHIQEVLFGLNFKERRQKQHKDIRKLYAKYQSFKKGHTGEFIEDKEELLFAFKHGLHPLEALKRCIQFKIFDDDYFKILNCCKFYFSEDLPSLNSIEIENLMKKYDFW